MLTLLWAKDTAERAGKTFLQVLIANVLLSGSFDLTASHAALLAAIAAGLTVVKAAVSVLVAGMSPASLAAGPRSYAKDIAERLALTFVEGFLASLLLSSTYDLNTAKAAVLAGAAGALSLLSSLLSGLTSNTVTPASLVEKHGTVRTHH